MKLLAVGSPPLIAAPPLTRVVPAPQEVPVMVFWVPDVKAEPGWVCRTVTVGRAPELVPVVHVAVAVAVAPAGGAPAGPDVLAMTTWVAVSAVRETHHEGLDGMISADEYLSQSNFRTHGFIRETLQSAGEQPKSSSRGGMTETSTRDDEGLYPSHVPGIVLCCLDNVEGT